MNIDAERLKNLRDQWSKRTDSQRDDLLDELLKRAWPTLEAQRS